MYQRGELIVGFMFGANITIDMTKRIEVASSGGMRSGIAVGSPLLLSSVGAAAMFFP